MGVSKWLGDQAKKGARAAGNKALGVAQSALAPRVVSQTGKNTGMSVGEDDVIEGGNLSKAEGIVKEIKTMVDTLHQYGVVSRTQWLRKFAAGKFSLDQTHSHQGTIVRVACPDAPTAMLVCQRLAPLERSDRSPVTDAGYESGNKGKAFVLVTLGNLYE